MAKRRPAHDSPVTLGGPTRLERLVHPATLVSLAVAQPLFDLLRREPTFLVAHRLGAGDLVALAALLGLGVPLLAGLPALAAGAIGRRAGAAVYAAAIALPAGWAALPLARQFGLGGPAIALGLSLAAGCALGWLAQARRPVRQALTLLSPVLALFPAAFLLRPPVAGLLRQAEAAARPSADPGLPATPVIVLVLDELPLASLLDAEGRVDRARFPGFAGLAQSATWYRNAATASPQTSWAVPAILTGRFPEGERLPVLRDHPDNLLAWMSRRVPTHSFEALTGLRPNARGGLAEAAAEPAVRRLKLALADLALVELHRVLPPALAAGLPPVTDGWTDFWGTGPEGGVPGQVERFLAGVAPTDGAAFHFAHFNLPHLPWRYLPSGREYGAPGASFHPPGLVGERWRAEEWPVIAGWQRHLLQVGYADRVVAELTAAVRRAGLWERALVVVVADHGASFLPGRSRRNVDGDNVDDLARVPLWIKFPGQSAAAIDDRAAATVDLAPTVFDVLGVAPPWPVDGVSLRAPAPSSRRLRLCDRFGREPVACQALALAPFDPRSGALAETLARQVARFGEGSDPGRIYRLGPWAGLVGEPVAGWRAAAASPRVLRLDEPAAFAAVDPESGFVPALVSGAVEDAGGLPLPADLAIAVDGVVAAVTRSHPRPPRWEEHDFAAMVPEEALPSGAHRIEVFDLQGSPGSPRPAPVVLRGAVEWRLEADSGGRVAALADREGRRVEVEDGALRGAVRRSRLDEATWIGWAAHGEPPGPAETVLVFAGDRYLAAAAPGAAGVLRVTGGPPGCGCGFSFVVPTGRLSAGEAARLRFFAVAGGRATEIPYSRTG